jgi:hypothetical protein
MNAPSPMPDSSYQPVLHYDLLLKRFTGILDLSGQTARHFVTVSAAVLGLVLVAAKAGAGIPEETVAFALLAVSAFLIVSGLAVTKHDANMRARAFFLGGELEEVYSRLPPGNFRRHTDTERAKLDEDIWYYTAQTGVPLAFITVVFLNSLLFYGFSQIPLPIGQSPTHWGFLIGNVVLLVASGWGWRWQWNCHPLYFKSIITN